MSRTTVLIAGAAAGAAGTTALNALTYADMALRGRPASSTPQQTVEKASDLVGLDVPGDEKTHDHRVSGLGSLLGAVTGVGVGLAVGALHSGRRRPGFAATAALAGTTAMVAGNGPMAVLGITDPRTWSLGSWVSDAVPHVAYAVVTAYVLRRMTR